MTGKKIKSVTINEREYFAANKQSAIVTSPSEKFYDDFINKDITKIYSEYPIPTYSRPPYIHGGNLTGTRRGGLVVVGYYKGRNKPQMKNRRSSSLWVVRCDCGSYEVRRGEKWRKGLRNKTYDECARCNKLRSRRQNYGRNDINEK